MHIVRLVCATVVLSFLPSTGFAQGPPPPPPPPPPAGAIRDAAPNKMGTARLSGRVVSLDSGRPIRRAVVTATGSELREGKSVSTDAEGRWELRDLPAGRLNLSAAKGGYVLLQYGQRRPYEAGKAIELANGQAIDKLDFLLPRASAVTGRVVDEFGEPVSNVRVSTMRYRFANGQRRLTNAGMTDMTDDLGQFRVHGLAPGDYYVVAHPQSMMSFLTVSGDRTGYAQTYYPSAHLPSDATRLTLTIGQEAQNILIALTPTRLVTLSGTAASSEGHPIKSGIVRLVDTGSSGPMTSMPGIIRPDGSWTIAGVMPGEYRLVAQMLRGSLEEVAYGGGVGTFPETVQVPLTVSGEDMTGIALVTAKASTLRGTVKWEGGTAPAGTSSLGSVLAFEPDGMGLAMSAGTIRDDGTFEIRSVVGKRQLRAGGFPRGWYLKSVMLNGQDITDTVIDVPPAQELTGVEINLTQRAAEINGSVQSSKGAAVSDYVLVVFPPEPDRWGWQSRFVQVARPDQAGRFTVQGLPEGTYLAAALEYMEPGEEGNPDFLEKLKPLATRVSVADGEKKTLALKISAQ